MLVDNSKHINSCVVHQIWIVGKKNVGKIGKEQEACLFVKTNYYTINSVCVSVNYFKKDN